MLNSLMRVLASSVVASIAANAAAQSPGEHATRREVYESADVDANGNLRIVTSDHRTIIVRKGGPPPATLPSNDASTGFDKPVVSPDRRAVGAQAMFGNCCTSYDIPLQLVVYSQGRRHRFEGTMAIFDWHFLDDGRRVAFSQQPVHFGCVVHWELRDISTERLLAQMDIPEPCGQDPNPRPVKVPEWVTGTVSGFK